MPSLVANFLSWMGVGLPAFLFVITLVVFIHELGHFVVARLCGVTVETFSIGFGREIFGFNDRHGTRWKLSWIPLGGYVKFAGDADASSRPDSASLQRMDSRTREGALHFKPLYQRALVAAVGVGFIEAVKGGVDQTWFIIAQTGSYLGKIVTGRESPDQLHGILGIGAVSDQAARIGFGALIGLAGLMSVSIGLVNLLPVPVLDGGHLLYYACEAVLGRPLGERAQEVGFRLGLAFVLCLMLLATFNDLVHLNLF